MKIELLAQAANQNVVTIGERSFYFSYSTCIAMRGPDGLYRRARTFSSSTAKHMTQMGVKDWPQVPDGRVRTFSPDLNASSSRPSGADLGEHLGSGKHAMSKAQLREWPWNNQPSKRHVWKTVWQHIDRPMGCERTFVERADTRGPIYCYATSAWLAAHPEDDGKEG